MLSLNTSPNARILLLATGMFLFLWMTVPALAQERPADRVRVSPSAIVSQTIGTTEVTITYGRPGVRDRLIFGELVPFDEVWRTGADEATTISFSDDVTLEGEPVEAGTYGLFTIPRGEGEWTIIINEVADQWGAYNYDRDADVARVNVPAEEAPFMEQMMIYFEEIAESTGTAVIHWDTVKVSFVIEEQ